MSNYNFRIKNYHSIEDAEIFINGITVLSGDNGCGKSTICRWLYYIVNQIYLFENTVYNEYKEALASLIDEWQFVLRTKLYGTQFRDSVSTNFDLEDSFKQILFSLAQKLAEYLSIETDTQNRNRLLNYLGVTSFENFSIEFLNIAKEKHDILQKDAIDKLQNRRLNDFVATISSVYQETDSYPQSIELQEDGVNIIEKNNVGRLLNLHNAIYIDTPMFLSINEGGNFNWRELRFLLNNRSKNSYQIPEVILSEIKKIVGGRFSEQNDLFGNKKLHFVSGSTDIAIEKTATGVKTFAYLYKLLENGHLTKNSILLIDEPEAHLHPQWIVDLAHILVLINKNIGSKIVLATHNPDMVSAVQTIADKEDLLSQTNFYGAVKNLDSMRYIFKQYFQDVENIFQSFNIALDKIESYESRL